MLLLLNVPLTLFVLRWPFLQGVADATVQISLLLGCLGLGNNPAFLNYSQVSGIAED